LRFIWRASLRSQQGPAAVPSILFVHNNFPAQFGFLGQRLAEAGWDVTFATAHERASSSTMRILRYEKGRDVTPGVHQYLRSTERAVITGQRAAKAFLEARERGYRPDVVMAHSGWGPGIFVRDVWPDAVYVPYLEWWYSYPLVDLEFLGEPSGGYDSMLRQRIRNTPQLIDLSVADFGIAPTRYQAAQFPADLRTRLEVIHDGVDTRLNAPSGLRPRRIAGVETGAMPEIVTYATRGMEPQRGFPQFMRALDILLGRRPGLHALIVGEDRVAYGRKLPDGESWKTRMLAELDLDLSRVHFTGRLARPDYLAVLQSSNAHVYLTVPFVLSWSMLEAMSVACPMVVSDTPPVREFMTHGETGLMADFHAPQAIADAVERLLDDRAEAGRLGAAARERIVADYEMEDIARRKREMLEAAIAARRSPAA